MIFSMDRISSKNNTKIIFAIATLLIILTSPMYISQVFAHGLGGDQAPPISFSGMKVTVFTELSPQDITVGEVDKAEIGVRFFDLLTNENLNAVTYRIEVWRGGELLARDLFYDQQGQMNVEIRPNSKCDEIEKIHCTKYFGERESTSNGLMKRGNQLPVIDGPIFDKGGLYNIKVDIEGASSPRTLVAEPLSFETFVSVAQEQDFFIQTSQAQEVPVIVKTYYDDVEDFKFDETANSISFDMPFDWSPGYVDLVQVVHEEIRVPKTFEPYKEGVQFKGFVDGVELADRAVLIDPYSSETQNIVHFLVTGSELKRINDELGSSHFKDNMIFFKLLPQSNKQKNSFQINFDSGVRATVEWSNEFGVGAEMPFDFTFFDPNGNLLKDVRYGYTILDETGSELITNIGNNPDDLGILASEGIDTQQILIPSEKVYQMEIAILGTGIGVKKDLSYSGIGKGFFELGNSQSQITQQTTAEEVSIPDWVRNNAGWWADGKIGDSDFASGIEFMIKNGIISVPATSSAQAADDAIIPDWIKNNAGWWKDDLISDDDFAKGLEYLVENGIILV